MSTYEDLVTRKAKRYVIYIRKSEEDTAKQIRSLEDQRRECLELAQKYQLPVDENEDIIEDSRSAKRSGNRPQFTELINLIRKRKVDGLIAWAPDRLARNMKEAGEIIDLLDEGCLVDLRFVAHHYINDYNGKMALGMAFVLAKQYSDKLSVDVKRGVGRSFGQGKSGGQYKPGYIRNNFTGYYDPDETVTASGKTQFQLMKEAFRKRMDGENLEDIVEFLNEGGYKRKIKKEKDVKMNPEQPMTKQKLSALFRDSLYYGVLVQNTVPINLLDLYDFVPMISEGEFYLIQKMGRGHEDLHHKHTYPFKGLVICGLCKEPMSPGASKSETGVRYLNFWCSNKSKGCPAKGTIRAKEVINELANIYDSFCDLSLDDYARYREEAKKEARERLDEIVRRLPVVAKELLRLEREYEGLIAAGLPRESLMSEHEHHAYLNAKKSFSDRIDHTKALKAELEQKTHVKPLDYENLLNLLKTLSISLKFGDPTVKDEIAQGTVLNFSVKDKKVASVSLKEPFKSLWKGGFVLNGGRSKT